MSHPPTTPVKVPASATTYSAATQDPDLRSQINTLMLRDGQITKIQEHLLHSLDAHNSNWPSAIQSHALALLRSGEVSTFPALMRRVLDDVRRETSSTTTESNGVNGTTTNGNNKTNGNSSSSAAAGESGGNGNSVGAGTQQSLAIPTAVVEAVLKVARESLEVLCEVEDGPSGG
ncbi:hypothetical protein F5Y16DRAFT_360685 [Xylariaceae sp. FL0255]|nr:hypothetical protein F5Y16DRAFT_360685 [Xylariaceae sp. FL0255]